MTQQDVVELSQEDFDEYKWLRRLVCDLREVSKKNLSLADKIALRRAMLIVDAYSDKVRGA